MRGPVLASPFVTLSKSMDHPQSRPGRTVPPDAHFSIHEMPSYTDQAFLDAIPDGEEYVISYAIAGRVGCTVATANRRCADLAADGQLDILDPEADEEMAPEDARETRRPVIAFRHSR